MENQIFELQYAMDTFYFLVCGALVMWMAAGFAMLEAGLVRGKNVTMQLTKNMGLFGLATIFYYLIGYNLMYPLGTWSIEGVLSGVWGPGVLEAVGVTADAADDYGYAATGSDFFFQLMFCAATASIVSGTLAERIKLWPFLIFTIILTSIIYPLSASWKWGGGFLDGAGFLDFAGSTVVHSVGGWAALAGAIILGPRIGKYKDGKTVPMPGSNLTLATLGTFILWLGWFGFNAGSELEADGTAGLAMINTFVATAAGALAWMLMERFAGHKGSALGFASGIIAGLVAVTPAAGNSGPFGALVLGIVASVIAYFAVAKLKPKLGYDDALDVFGIHGIAGIVGAIGTGIVYSPALGGPGDAAEYAMGAQVTTQIVAVVVAIVWATVGTVIATLITKVITGLRVTPEVESDGLDIGEHGERAYN